MENKVPRLWRQSKIIAILKPGKVYTMPMNYRPISLLCHMYKLYESLTLDRIAPIVKWHLINDQSGFRSGKPCTIQPLNFTQNIEDGYQKGMITGATFVDLSAAYETVNHIIIMQKLCNTTHDNTHVYVECPIEFLYGTEQQAKQMDKSVEWPASLHIRKPTLTSLNILCRS